MRNAKVLFIVPREEDPPLYFFAPLAILSLARRLAESGHETPILDAKLLGDGFLARVREEARDAQVLWASGKIGRQLVDLLAGMKAAKEANPGIRVLFGGWHATLEPASTIATPVVDAVVRGPAEFALLEAVQALEAGRDLSGIPGITFKRDGQVIAGPDRPWDRDLDQHLPLPYHLIDLERYITADGGRGEPMVPGVARSLNYTSSRGCHGRCTFCHITAMCGRKWFGASPARVLDDLEMLVRERRVQGIDFHDSNFFTNKTRAERIMEGMIARGLSLKWRASVRADQILSYPDSTLRLMADSGAVEMAIGGESGSPRIMDLVAKDTTPQMVVDCSRRLLAFGIQPVYSFMVGFPDERRWRDTRRTIAFMAELRALAPDSPIEYFYYTPFPGTPLFNYAVEKGGLVAPTTLEGWTAFSPYDPNMPWVDRRLARILRIAKTFYFRFAVPDAPMRERLARHRLRHPLRLLAWIARVRVRHGWYGLAVEYRMARFLKDVVIGRWGFFPRLREIL